MAREKRTSEQLQAASDPLHYELWMFQKTAEALATGICGEGVLHNALLESFVIHARNLLDFLYPKKNLWPDDVIAGDFFDDPKSWISERPSKSEKIASLHNRAGKEVAHLTYARLDVTPETKPWQFVEIANEVVSVFDKFLAIVPLDRLGDRWSELKSQRMQAD